MSVKDEIWSFAIHNPDYWALLRSNEEPPEVAELETADRDAFNAARREVQRRLLRLIRACVHELDRRAQGTFLGDRFAWNPQDNSILNNSVRATLPSRQGWLYFTTDPQDGVIWLSASIWMAKKRRSEAHDVLKTAEMRGERFWYSVQLGPAESDEILAARLADAYWPEVFEWVRGCEGEQSSAEAPPDDAESGGGA